MPRAVQRATAADVPYSMSSGCATTQSTRRKDSSGRAGNAMSAILPEHPKHEQVSSRLPSRLVSLASAPEFGELLGKGSALVVTGSSGGRTRRQIHQSGAECVAGIAIREDGFDCAAAGAELLGLCC